MIRIDSVRPNPKNPRSMKETAFQKLCQSIKRDPEFMLLRPIVVDDNGVILGGNMRFKAIVQLGMSEVPDGWILRASEMSEEQKQRFVLVDNSPEGMAGDWDWDMLANAWDIQELEKLGLETIPVSMEELGGFSSEEKTTDGFVDTTEDKQKTVRCSNCGFEFLP